MSPNELRPVLEEFHYTCPKSQPLHLFKFPLAYFSVPASPGQPVPYAGGTRWTQCRRNAVDSSPSMALYACLKSPLLHPSKCIHCISQCLHRPVSLEPMPAARGGLKPVQGHLQLSKISPFTPVEVYTWYFSMPASPGQPVPFATAEYFLTILGRLIGLGRTFSCFKFESDRLE